MYLKSIEIQGFKSFAGKTRLEFHNGITAIVGPNGSGKSNIADACRWVLGEQRAKQLRGSSMQDVIFSGTQARRPMGFAYVAITFDNSDHRLAVDYEEVTVARRIYRSGENEYLLNGTVCRLRDINELFYDTGIGKEGYSIIGQGQIDRILSDRPQDRRDLFDEAAGIVKYKKRKEITLKKLTNEEDNLTRINDILSEIERQLPSLKEQQEKANIFLRTKAKLRELDINAFLLENDKNTAQLQKLENSYAVASSHLAQVKASLEEEGAAYGQNQKEVDELDDGIAQVRDQISTADALHSRIESDIKVYEEQIRSAMQSDGHFQSRKEDLTREISERKKERQDISDGKRDVDEEIRKYRSLVDGAQTELNRVRLQIKKLSQGVDEKKAEILDILNRRGSIKSKLASLSTMGEQLQKRREELSEREAKIHSDESRQDEVIENLKAEFSVVSDAISDLQKKQDLIEEELSAKKQLLAGKDAKLRAAQSDFHRQKSRLEALENLAQRYEGFGQSVRRVMQHKEEEPGLCGVVADLIKTRPEYETAIEVALGGSIQNIVTEDEETARRMISMLKKERAGRATFLPLTGIKRTQRSIDSSLLRETGVIGTGNSLVTADARYLPVTEYLLGNVLIVDTFDTAVRIERNYRRSPRMVTLEGELFTPGGAISGGAYRSSSNLLGRQREIASLRAETGKLTLEINSIQKDIEKIKADRNDLRRQRENIASGLQEKFLSQNTIRMNLISEEDKKKEAGADAARMEEDRAGIDKETVRTKKEREENRKLLEESLLREKILAGDSNKEEEQLAALREEEGRQAQLISGWDAELGKISQKQDFEKSRIDRLDEEINRLESDLKKVLEDIAKGQKDIAGRRKQVESLRGELKDSSENQKSSRDLLEKKQYERQQLLKQTKDILAKREELQNEIGSLDRECVRLESRSERIRDLIEQQASYLWDEYELTPTDAAALRSENPGSLTGLHENIESYKKQIRELGTVNVNAVEQYRELNERYTFLKGQHDDLTSAADKLRKIVGDLDRQMRRQFKEQFGKISEEFNRVFRELFGGGKGMLELMEGEDILEAGVKVIAQPPGKKLINMMQMSGGEKALTAISLLFAIQNLRPSPFCLLDEIEAALDESNVDRFAHYLHRLREHTQFIVITHRRGTMEAADRLYGITMQEKGISAMVSVDLIDEKDLTA